MKMRSAALVRAARVPCLRAKPPASKVEIPAASNKDEGIGTGCRQKAACHPFILDTCAQEKVNSSLLRWFHLASSRPSCFRPVTVPFQTVRGFMLSMLKWVVLCIGLLLLGDFLESGLAAE